MKPIELSAERMALAAREATATLRALANEDRLQLLCSLGYGEKCVGELEALVGIRQPSLSQQLGVLRNEGIVKTRRDGKKIYYSIADLRVLELLKTMVDVFCPKQGA